MTNIIFRNLDAKPLNKILSENGFSNRAIRNLYKKSLIYVDDKLINKNKKINNNSTIKIIVPKENLDYEPIYGKLEILYEDSNLLIVDKKKNLTVNSKGQESLANHIAYYFMEKNIKSKIRFINRLDMNTSGIIMIAKNPYSMSYYQKQIEDNKIKKIYIAEVSGDFLKDGMYSLKIKYDSDLKKYIVSEDGVMTKTKFQKLYYKDNISIIKVYLLTGKTHQIRSTLSYLGYPIIGDTLYGSDIKIDGFKLNSSFLSFNKFITGEKVEIKSNFISQEIFDFL